MMEIESACERVKALRILNPTKGDSDKVDELIRQHEKRFLYDGHLTAIKLMPALGHSDWNWFLGGLEYAAWKQKGDLHFGSKYSKAAVGSYMMSSSGKIIDSAVRTQTSLAINMLMKKGVPKMTAVHKILPLASHIFIGYLMRELMPLDDNPYEPALRLLELGYIPRRINDATWKIVYMPP